MGAYKLAEELRENRARVQLINGERINRSVAVGPTINKVTVQWHGRTIRGRISYYLDRDKLNFTIHLICIKEGCRGEVDLARY